MQKLIITLISATVIIQAINGCGNDSGKKQGSEHGQSRGTPVDGLIIREKSVDFTYTTTGSLLANEEIELRNEVPGRITGIFFSEGSWVSKGDLLVKIYDQDLQAQLKKTESQLELARDEEKRKKSLFDQQLASREEYDISLNKLKVLEADKDLIRAQISKTEITAPFGGRIGLRSVSPGAFISANTMIATLQQTDPVKIEFMIPDRYHAMLKTGTRIRFRLSDDSTDYPAEVYAFDSKVDPSTRSLKVRARRSNSHFLLKPGTLAKIDITLENIPKAIMIPANALVPELNGQKIFLFSGGTVTSRPVQTGLRTETEIQITGGLHPADTIITTGLLQIREGSKVFLKSIQ